MDRRIRLLVLEDNPSDAELAVHELRRAGFRPRWELAETEAEFVDKLRPDLDLIIADFRLPSFTGLDALRRVRERELDVPVIIVSGTIGEELAVQLIKEGAADYLLKDRLGRLGTAASQAMEFRRQRLDKERAEQALRLLSRIRAVLSGINATIVRVRDRRQLLSKACEIVKTCGEFERVWIGLCRSEGAALHWFDPAGDSLGHATPIVPPDPVPALAKKAITERKPLLQNHLQDAQTAQSLSVAMLPIGLGDKPLGVLGLRTSRKLDLEELNMLVEVAADLAFALDHIEKANQLDYLAYYDPITGLPNRRLFGDRLEQALHLTPDVNAIATLVVGFDRMSRLTEIFGQAMVDELCRAIANRLKAALGAQSRIGHFGVGEFGVMFPGQVTGTALGHAIEADILAPLSQPFQVNSRELKLSVRIGIAVAPADGSDAQSLLHNAEAALQGCRESGERYLFYSPEIHETMSRKLTMESRLRMALDRDQFVLFYQPKVDSYAGQLTGVEALLRWNDPERGLVSPNEFIPLLEETGLIIEVGDWVVDRAVSEYLEWLSRGLRVPAVAVNVSPKQMRQRHFVDHIDDAVQRIGEDLELEITESVLMEDTERNIETLNALRELGASVAIDDFGTGYSSLSYLSRMPVTALKIDRAFISNMTKGPNDMAIVTSVISLAHAMNLVVIAEGVETEEQANLLRLLRCDQMQGFLHGRPERQVRV